MFRMWILGSILGCVLAQTNLLQNGDFESTNYHGNWYCMSCDLSANNDAYHGKHSVNVSNRQQNWQGAAQNVGIQGNEIYRASAYVKLWNTHYNKPYQKVSYMLNCKDSNGQDKNVTFGQTTRVQPGQWYEVGGAIQVMNGAHDCHIYIQTEAPTDYLLDSASLVHIPHDTNWKTHANQRINANRKADITVSLAGSGIDASTVQIELKQDKMEFILGSEVTATRIVGSADQAYQNTFYKNFEWAVLGNALKWHNNEPTQHNLFYNTSVTAINSLKQHGIKVRCHTVFWDTEGYGKRPWVKALNRTDLLAAIQRRIHDVIGHTHGKCEQWDVNNEIFHNDFYERHTGNPDITMDMFKQVHAADSHPDLYLNDFGVISHADSATEMKDTAIKYKKAGIPVGGIGVQGHLHMFNVELIKARLDIIAEAGLPIMVTEFAVNVKDENRKAAILTDLLTLFFSHPSVKGVMFWGFWDQLIWEHDAAFYTGPNITPNAAGRAYENVFHNTWRTHITHTLHGSQPYHVRGFKGDYTLTVTHGHDTLKTETFTLTDGGKNIQIHLNGTHGGSPSVSHVIVG